MRPLAESASELTARHDPMRPPFRGRAHRRSRGHHRASSGCRGIRCPAQPTESANSSAVVAILST
ncbi:hypothetical protein ACFFRL_17850 [Agromyces hippuratus]|uniref:hypothetical protein n=1 Tax=Agromyces hippuratus TaxID=286438 RepID=UPI0035EF8BA2